MSDPVVRRVAGAVLLLAAVGVMLVFDYVVGDGPIPMPAGALTVALAGGLGAVGLLLLLRPTGRGKP